MNVTLAGLRAIEALAAHGSITAAAGALGYTPSAVSQQIARLERDAREELVERQGRRLILTQAGRIMAAAASRVLIELEGAGAELQRQSGEVTGGLVVAAFPSAARGIVPVAMAALLRQAPTVQLRLIEADSHAAIGLVADGGVDLAIAHDWEVMPLSLPDELESTHLGDDVSDILIHQDHPLATSDFVDLPDLSGEAWMYEPGSVAHDFLLHAFRAQTHPLANGHVVIEYATQIELVAAGLGIALVPRMGRGTLPGTVHMLAVRSPPIRRIYGVWRRSVGRRPVIASALHALRAARQGGGASTVRFADGDDSATSPSFRLAPADGAEAD